MNKLHNMSDAFTAYLESNLSLQTGQVLAASLENQGLHLHGQALRMHVGKEGDAKFRIQQGLWKDRVCHVGAHPPFPAEAGDVWFDVVEISPMILIPDIDDVSMTNETRRGFPRWLSIQPVYVWQFMGFMALVKLEEKYRPFFAPRDYLDASRFVGQEEMNFVSNLYQDEALAYSFWFHKGILGNIELEAAQSFLPKSHFEALMPDTMHLWDPSEPSEGERIAVSKALVGKPYKKAHQFYGQNSDVNHPGQMIFGEGIKTPRIGFSTETSYFDGVFNFDKPKTYWSVRLENVAPRPPKLIR
ncbi:MAG: hypothetical protein L0Y56_01395 [Nitrospira sp.]|nr:hypothetical protein [Nitrospira sp.]